MYVAITLYFSSLLHFQNQKEISITTSHCYQYQEDTHKRCLNKMKFYMSVVDKLLLESAR